MTGTQKHPVPLLAILGDTSGWNIVVALSRSDYLPRDLATELALSQEQVAHHLAVLEELGLVQERQSDARPGDTFYRLNLEALREAWTAAGAAIHPVVGGITDVVPEALPPAKTRVLFLCTGNSARSQMAEGLMRQASNGKVEVYSAGSAPSQLHPLAVQTMANAGIDIRQQRSKHMDEFLNQSFDYVITVCDNQRETCPVFPGNPSRIHWSFSDPAAVESDVAREQAFRSTAAQLKTMIRFFLVTLERKERTA